MSSIRTARWMQTTLWIAAAYNVLWGASVVFLPTLFFHWANLPDPNYLEIWECIGMIVGVFGLGYAIAATNPLRHWPIVLVGLIGKVLGPVGFLHAVQLGHLPWRFGWILVGNDLIWWVPFGLILKNTYDFHLNTLRGSAPEVVRFSLRTRTNMGVNLDELSRMSPVLLVFLRHAGCTFCREALADIAEQRREIEAAGARIVLVHMGTDQQASEFFPTYGLDEILRVSDPRKNLYRAFGLQRGNLVKILGPRVWGRGLHAAIVKRHGLAFVGQDVLQMPGVFLLFHGEVIRAYRHQSVADRPRYAEFARQENFLQLGMQS